MAVPANTKPTQNFLLINEVRDDLIVMKDGTLRLVLAVSSVNFDLKSQDEQNALIYGYQRFLNSLEYPIQILMQSRKMDIGEYVEKLRGIMQKQTNELLRIQTQEYIAYINQLVESANVMTKNFYVVIPISFSISPQSGNLFDRVLGKSSSRASAERLENFRKYKKQLDERGLAIQSNLASMGLRVSRLNTPQLIELLYNSYNFAAGPLIDATQLDNVTLLDQDQIA